MGERKTRVYAYIAHFLGVLVLLAGACIIAFGGGALFEVLATAFNAGRDFIAADLKGLIR